MSGCRRSRVGRSARRGIEGLWAPFPGRVARFGERGEGQGVKVSATARRRNTKSAGSFLTTTVHAWRPGDAPERDAYREGGITYRTAERGGDWGAVPRAGAHTVGAHRGRHAPPLQRQPAQGLIQRRSRPWRRASA